MARKKKPTAERDSEEGGAGPATGDAAAQDALPRPASAAAARGYLVLARKYRPATFGDLIGQDTMVATLKNAFATERIAQGYMLTGVRGVGKTTTARILSRALNYETEGVAKPTFDMPRYGRHCLEIMEGRHPDVLEMDAASNTGVDNVREIIENARYKPMLARTKVYLIDEVHMLSKGAFNALLKTLEEPPPHVKFIFATTEARKVPLTVLSRCQRFDLRRVEVPVLAAHLRQIVANEGAQAEEEALLLIARAAEGSVRDALSLLDQALAMGAGTAGTQQVRGMLGLADRGRIYDLLEALLNAAAAEALRIWEGLFRDGGDPAQILGDLASAVHVASRAKTLGAAAVGEGISGEERRRALALAQRLSVPILARAWQMLLKGLEEVAAAPDPSAAAEMVLIRLAYTADLPSPDEVIKALRNGAAARPADVAAPSTAATAPSSTAASTALDAPLDAASAEPSAVLEALGDEESDAAFELTAEAPQFPVLREFVDVVALAGERREAKLKVHLEEHVSLVRFDPGGRIELNLLPGAPNTLANALREKLNAWTGRLWVVALSNPPGAPPLGQVARERAAAEIRNIAGHPAIAAVLAQFPDAQVAEVRPLPAAERNETGTG